MAIGRTFEEAIQKGLRMIGQGMHGFVANHEISIPNIDKALSEPTDKRIFVIAKAMYEGYTVEQIHDLTKIDKWFLYKLHNIIATSLELERHNTLGELPDELLKLAKYQRIQRFPDRKIYIQAFDARWGVNGPCRTTAPAFIRYRSCSQTDRHPCSRNTLHAPTTSTSPTTEARTTSIIPTTAVR